MALVSVTGIFTAFAFESGMNLREKVYDNFRSAIEVIIHQKPDILVHAGDLFDVVKPKTRAYSCSKHSTGSTLP